MPQSQLLTNLNPSQKEAVLQTEGPILILAGPGSGKTRCLAHKIAFLVQEKKVDPGRILGVTFTNKAANEMRERVTKLSENPKQKFPWIGTFHATCAKILRRDGKNLGIPPNFLIYDETDQIQLVKKVLKKIDLNEQKMNPKAVLNAVSSAKNELVAPDAYAALARGFFQETVSRLYPEYQKALTQNSALDFDDLIMRTIELFEKNPAILNIYQRLFQYILVDEYQDTNKAQYVLTKLLSGKRQNICVVGDPGQSIYAWRGADIRNILQFEADYPKVKIIRLEQNYRSTQTIIEAASRLIQHNPSHPKLILWTENSTGESLKVIETADEEREANFLSREIAFDNRPFSDFVVLYRTNAQSRVIEEVFLKTKIPYTILGGTRFYERKEIKDILAYLRLFANPQDSVSLERAEKIGKHRLSRVLTLQKEINPSRVSPLEILDQVLTVSQYLETLKDKTEEGEGKVENVKELRSVATDFVNLADFLENVALVQQEYLPDVNKSPGGANQNVVKLMTLHTAKGLEFPIVFIVGFEEGLLPHSRSLIDKLELEEERRLCYVGITRAKEKVYLTHAQKRLFFGSTSFNEVSRFLDELPSELIEKWQV
ncbi:MAG: UvrD-helicase domain-containing protein [Patescibacteria group bacterium]